MSYTEINAIRVLARKMWDNRDRPGVLQHIRWLDLPPRYRREYERDAEKLFDLKDEETRDALLHLLNRS